MSEVQRKNENIIQLNQIDWDIETTIRNIKKYLNEHKDIYNIVDIYRNKMLDMESFFRNFGLPFYTDNALGHIILSYMDYQLVAAVNILGSTYLRILKFDRLSFWLEDVVQLMTAKSIDKYLRICDNINNLSIDNILNVIKFNFKRPELVLPGQLFEEYYKTKEILNLVGRTDILPKVRSIEYIVRSKESKLASLYEQIKTKYDFNSNEEAKEFINSLLMEYKEEKTKKLKY